MRAWTRRRKYVKNIYFSVLRHQKIVLKGARAPSVPRPVSPKEMNKISCCLAMQSSGFEWLLVSEVEVVGCKGACESPLGWKLLANQIIYQLS